jgi:hypothetical protein
LRGAARRRRARLAGGALLGVGARGWLVAALLGRLFGGAARLGVGGSAAGD